MISPIEYKAKKLYILDQTLLPSEERYIELKGSDIPHAIVQLRTTILKLGEHDGNRHSYVVCTKVAPRITTAIQKAKVEFRKRLKSDLQIKETPLDVQL